MRDAELYLTILGLSEPWSVGRVDLDVDGQRVDLWVEHEAGVRWPCAVCGESLGCYDHAQRVTSVPHGTTKPSTQTVSAQAPAKNTTSKKPLFFQ